MTEKEWEVAKKALDYTVYDIVEAMNLASKNKYTQVQILLFIKQKEILNIDDFIILHKL